MENSSANHCNFDLSEINHPTNIRYEKELEQEISKICEVLKDTCMPAESLLTV